MAKGGIGAVEGNDPATTLMGGLGGAALHSIGFVKTSGGAGGNGVNNGATHSAGGGGAGGPNGAGGHGESAANSATAGGLANNGVSGSSSGNGGHGVTATNLGTYGVNYGGGGAGGGGASQNGGNGAPGFVRITEMASPAPEIRLTGLGLEINNNNTPATADNTDFEIADVGSDVTRTFTIYNVGSADLHLTFSNGSGDPELGLASIPGATITTGSNESLTVRFSPSSDAVFNNSIIINTNDPNLPVFQLNVTGEGRYVFFDSDGDGVYDNVDEDDDNDGILDADEQGACASGGHILAGATSASYKLLNETFGTGTDRSSSLSNLYNASTTYRNEDGTGTNGTNPDFSDGEYTVYHQISTSNTDPGPSPGWNTRGDVASYSWYAWGLIEDHTPNDTDGKMAIFNADAFPGVFYEAEIVGVIPNVPIDFGFWVINLDNRDDVILSHGGSVGPNGYRLLPEVRVEFLALDGTVFDTFEPGEITRCNDGLFPGDTGYNLCDESVWIEFTHNITTSESSFIVRLSNIGPGGSGNDLAIDDITVNQALCDRDGDGVADLYDLDSDNDGIPDAVEAGLGQYTSGNGILNGPVNTSNGLMTHAGVTPVDSDGDGIPDYLDLDSDNDGVFDVDEYGGGNTIVTTFQHGDGDISGNGVGDGPETENFRERDLDGDGIADAVGFGDGILDIFDFHQGMYGTAGQEPATTVPNYQDPMSDGTTLDYTKLDVLDPSLFDASGVLKDNTDADGDGIMDSRDGDNTLFGSPRDYDDSYSLYFDGRNDYVEEPEFLNGTSEGTMMCWVKIDPSASGAEFIIGEEGLNFIYAGNNIDLFVNSNLVKKEPIVKGVWVHLACTYSSSPDEVKFYVNGEEVGTGTTGGVISNQPAADTFNMGVGPGGSSTSYFKGEIDEVRVFSRALTETEVKRMVYQELDEDPSYNFNRGKIIPRDISTASVGADLIRYYKMDHYEDDKLIDISGKNTTGATIYNAKDILFQTAPLPYVTTQTGNWVAPNVWEHGGVWDITTKKDDPNDAAIILVKDAIITREIQGALGIIVESGGKITVEDDKALYNTWYTKLDGTLDIEGESQFIQTEGTELDPTSTGFLEIDQQGTKDLYTYNYWGSPVGLQGPGTNNTSFTLANVLYDGTNAGISSKPKVAFTSSGYNGSPSPLTLADYWVYKFVNGTADEYYAWKQVRSTGTIDVGEGFSLKGSDNTATSFNETQNYSFRGMPNNGDITLKIDPGNEYLIGNPYPSAIDADEFLRNHIGTSDNGDNTSGNIINGALYFWQHFANKTHVLREYEGGYAVYCLTGGTLAVSRDPLINNSGQFGTIIPKKIIPPGQGFFVSATDDPYVNSLTYNPGLVNPIVGGDIVFKNSQRVFETESGGNSVFIKEGSSKKSAQTTSAKIDTREKIKLRFKSSTGVNRQLLVGVDSLASSGFNIGYDAPLIEDFSEDMYWYFVNSKFVIQGIDSFDESVVLPLGVKVAQQGLVSMSIDSLQNIDAAKNIYLYDKFKDVYHDLRVSDYEVNLSAGEYLDRFALTFSKQAVLATQEELEANFGITYANNEKALIIKNPKNMAVTSVAVYSSLGQLIHSFNDEDDAARIVKSLNNLSQGAYLVKVSTEQGVVAKMIVVN
ncbi:LamG-like jellyroll fold domain-containing protein [Pseudotamlana agarivorans]|uniref:LamG-like jellyroll fold domain-containing protein n=1 Tax=Pseudotamlana agarivorans TaxID=481183 RepID=UPI000834ED32|nr:LamG-like jellyroll fold domain-containing protein [Tamlana agarivorans]